MLPIKLHRPLAIFDIESTGISPRVDRIIELAIIRIHPEGRIENRTWLVNPTIPIPLETTAIHGISDEHVADCPTFTDIARDVQDYLENCDLGGFNVDRFDIPMLCEEFQRSGIFFDVDSRRVIDAQKIFHQREPRTLSAALSFYCDEEHTDAHGALPDADATLKVLSGQFARYGDLPLDIEELDRLLNPRDPFAADRSGKLRWLDGEIIINFGRKKGKRVRDLAEQDPGYLKWILKSDFPMDTRKIVEDALNGRFPDPPPITASSKLSLS